MRRHAVLVLLFAAAVFALTAEEEMCLGEGANKANCAKTQCAVHKYCDTCTKDIRCGWCESDKICLPGGAAGPLKANCTSWDYAMCSALPCSQHTGCDSCAKDPMCGWCATSNICTEGSIRGPVFITCIKKDWMHEADQCNALYQAPCPCPVNNGLDCLSAEKCERNNFIGDKVASDSNPPENLDEIAWYTPVDDQIHVDVVPVPIATPVPTPVPTPEPTQVVPMPKSEIHPGNSGANMPSRA